jgi:acetyl-CoA carboxylase biotin carboxyl carrier protein
MTTLVVAPITGIVWKILVSVGDSLTPGQTVMILESMKMEVPVLSPSAGIVHSLTVCSGDSVEDGDTLATLIR